MTIQSTDRPGPPFWSLKGFNLGLRLALPVAPAMIAFGLAVGATAARKGLDLMDSVLMNLLIYAGAAQLVAMEAWPQHFTATAIMGLAFICAVINARLVLITASLHPWLGPAAGMAGLSGAADHHRPELADRDALSRRGRLRRRRFPRLEPHALDRLDEREHGGLSAPVR